MTLAFLIKIALLKCSKIIIQQITVVCLAKIDVMHFSIFAMVDSENHCVPVTIYNMALGSGFAVGDSVAIPEPFCQETDFTENEQVFAS